MLLGWTIYEANIVVSQDVDISNLENKTQEIKRALSVLPKREQKWTGERFGYHSVFRSSNAGSEPMHEWVQLQLNQLTPTRAIVLAPAVDPQGNQTQSYGFPRRFRIEFRTEINGKIIHLIDHTHEDFPDPGVAPVIFDKLNFDARYIRLIVEKGQVGNGMEFFALSEIFVMEQRESGMVNVAPYSQRTASGDLQSYPFWDIRFLADGLSALGMPLGVGETKHTNFIAKYPLMKNNETVEIVIDLGGEKHMGRMAFYPADPPYNILLPHFGYPDRMVIEVFNDVSLKKSIYRMEVYPDYKLRKHDRHIQFRPATDLAFAVPMSSAAGRYVRVKSSGLSDYDGFSILAFGEIILWGADENLSMDCEVNVTSPRASITPIEPKRLVDGYVNSCPIVDTFQWLEGLARRETLERELAKVSATLMERKLALERWWKYAARLVLILLLMIVVYLALRIRMRRIRAVIELRNQISRDLHDDVGCNLGSIAMGISNLKDEVNNVSLDEEFDELYQVACETSVALEEAVFFNQRGQITVKEFVSRLEQRTHLVVGDKEVEFTVVGTFPNKSIDLRKKRQISLIFKEALYNCVRHAHATKIEVLVSLEVDRFRLAINDNGVGFDVSELSRISGIDNMKKRAEKVAGKFTIKSAMTKGTSFELVVDY